MELIKKYFADFTPEQEAQFAMLKDLYTDWNEKINVISRKDIDNFYRQYRFSPLPPPKLYYQKTQNKKRKIEKLSKRNLLKFFGIC